MDAYYSDPLMALVHTGLFIKKYSQMPSTLAKVLNISDERLNTYIDQLKRLGLIQHVKGHPIAQVATLHLPLDSPHFTNWISQVRLLAASKLLLNSKASNYHFAVFFSANEHAKRQIQTEFLKFLDRIKAVVDQTPSEDLYYIGFDLLPWQETP
jgi:hypothetical protein